MVSDGFKVHVASADCRLPSDRSLIEVFRGEAQAFTGCADIELGHASKGTDGIKNVHAQVTLVSANSALPEDYLVISRAGSTPLAARDYWLIPLAWNKVIGTMRFLQTLFSPDDPESVNIVEALSQFDHVELHFADPVVLPTIRISRFEVDGGIPAEDRRLVEDAIARALRSETGFRQVLRCDLGKGLLASPEEAPEPVG
jgi:hypothetical protein